MEPECVRPSDAPAENKKRRSSSSWPTWILFVMAVLSLGTLFASTYCQSEYGNGWGPFPRTENVELPAGYSTHVTPTGSNSSCAAQGPAELQLIEQADGYVLARYLSLHESDGRVVCNDGILIVERLRDWNWRLNSVNSFLNNLAEEQRRRDAENRFVR